MTSPPKRAGSRDGSMFHRLMSTLTRTRSTRDRHEQAPVVEDLGVRTLRHVYSQYILIQNPFEKEKELYKLLPLFCKNCEKYTGQELVTKFPDAFEFAENVALLFVRHVTQLAQTGNARSGAALLKYFNAGEDTEVGGETGLMILKVIHILANGPDSLVSAMMTSNLSAVLVRCVHLFLDLPPPAFHQERPRSGNRSHLSVQQSSLTATQAVPGEGTEGEGNKEMKHRSSLEKLIRSLLNRLMRHSSAVQDLLRFDDLPLLFGAISSPCPSYNKMWRKTAADCLMAICRHSLTGDVISFIHNKGCIGFCIRNIKLAVDQPPLELVEIFATIFCCLKDSADFSQVLLDDFSSCGGYKLLYDYLLYLEKKGTEEAREAERNLILLMQKLIFAGFVDLEPKLSDGGPFQDPSFTTPVPLGENCSVKNCDAFLVLQDAFLSSQSSHLGKEIAEAILNVFRFDPANYFILESYHSLSMFVEKLPTKNEDVQAHTFLLLEYVVMELGYVPVPELTSVGLLLQQREYPKTLTLSLNFLLKLISFNDMYKNIFREVGILTMLSTALKEYASQLKEERAGDPTNIDGLSSPSLPLDLEDVQGEEEECVFLLMECLRATIEGNVQNGQVFREAGGTKCVLRMVNYKKPRRMALRLVTQLILLDDGSVDFTALLDQLNLSSQTAVVVKSEILHTVLGVFQLDSSKKAVFREVCGFHYLISVLASLIGSLAPQRCSPWLGVSRADILQLVQLVFTVMTSAMQDDPANKKFFENNIRFDSFTAPLLLLGCFAKGVEKFPSSPALSPGLTLDSSSSFTSFVSEFKTWQPPSAEIDPNSFVFAAAEILRFLRDMALEVSTTQSKSLIQNQHGNKSFCGSPPPTPAVHLRGTPSSHLVHTGAVLCMLDLLPAITFDPSQYPGDISEIKVSYSIGSQNSIDKVHENLVKKSHVKENRREKNVNLLNVTKLDALIGSLQGGTKVDSGDEVQSWVLEQDDMMTKGYGDEVPLPRDSMIRACGDRAEGGGHDVDVRGLVAREDDNVDGLSVSRMMEGISGVGRSVSGAGGSGSGAGMSVRGAGESVSGAVVSVSVDSVERGEGMVWAGKLTRKRDKTEEKEETVWETEYCRMSAEEAHKWCVFLQERVVSEIYSMAMSERNQQALCQIGLPQRMLQRCGSVLSDESHPLHEAMERTFERLSYQALTPADFRNFLRLGNPLNCSLNDITAEDLKRASNLCPDPNENTAATANKDHSADDKEKVTNKSGALKSQTANQVAPYGGSLSLARIQSLVSMTTPRDGFHMGMISSPPFVEFDLSIDGFGCLFLPSVFPLSIDRTVTTGGQTTTVSTTTGTGGGGERPFPPSNGLTFSSWILINKYSSEDPHPISLLTLTQTFLTADKHVTHYPVLRIYINLAEQSVVVTTQPPRDRRDTLTEDVVTKVEEAVFNCDGVFQLHTWQHIAVVINKTGLRGKAKTMLYVDGNLLGTHKMTYIHLFHLPDSTTFLPYPSEATPYLINAHVGTHVTQRCVSPLTYRLGPTFLFEDPISLAVAKHIHNLGPCYIGSFQAPTLNQSFSISPGTLNVPMNALVPDEKTVFGLIASHPSHKTVHELTKAHSYSSVDIAYITRELSLKDEDDVTPVTLLHNMVGHLYGPSRPLGAVVCGYSGIRTFEPQPLRSLLSSVGGTSVVLGLVAMATTVDSLYASMKALVCIVGNNQLALKEMERTGGFKVLGMLLRSKAELINSNILHLTYTLVGTVNSEHESACIPNPVAFQDLLADLAVWSTAGEDIQRSLYHHFYDLLTHSSNRMENAKEMLRMKLISLLLFRLHNQKLSHKTIKAICNVLSALLGSSPGSEDVRRVGQLLATTLPGSRRSLENTILLYDHQNPDDQEDAEDIPTEHAQEYGSHGDADKQRRAIFLRNMLLDVILSLLTTDTLVLNTQFAQQIHQALGFDWLMLFLHNNIHKETVNRALRILVQLLSDSTLLQKFHEGDIFGGWVHGFETISPEMSQLLETSTANFNPFKPSMHKPLPGAAVLSVLLPNHSHSSQVYLLMVAILLGRTCVDIPFSANFDLEALDLIFQVGSSSRMEQAKICPDAAYVLLAMARALVHQDTMDRALQNPALVLIKFLERIYRTLPQFATFARKAEFIEALATTLFSTTQRGGGIDSESDTQEYEAEDGFVVVDTASLNSQGAAAEGKPLLLYLTRNVVVCSIVKLLRVIAVDGFSSTHVSQKEGTLVCPILESVLNAAPPNVSPELQKQYQTLILHSIVDYLQTGNEDILVLFKGSDPNLQAKSIMGLSVFCSRLVDKVWQGVYLKPSSGVYNFLVALVEQARKLPNTLPLGDLIRSMNRIILHQVSTIPSSESDQKALMDTLCLFSSQAHVIFDDTNVDTEFLECLTLRLMKIAFASERKDDSEVKLPGGYVPVVSLSMMKSGANRLWNKMLEYKHEALEQILAVDLPMPKPNLRDPTAMLVSSQSLPPILKAKSSYAKLQHCAELMTEQLEKAWSVYESGEMAQQEMLHGGSQSGVQLKKSAIFRTSRKKVARSKEMREAGEATVTEYTEVLCPLLVLAAQKYEEILLRKYQRNLEYKFRFTASEWDRIEHELTRERGLWGPDNSSKVDKWILDCVEGPCRMRKRMCRNHLFYQHYPYSASPEPTIKSKHQRPISFDSEFHHNRAQLFLRPTLLTTPTSSCHDKQIPLPHWHDSFMNVSIEYPHLAGATEAPNSPAVLGSKLDPFNHPDVDDPVAQALSKMIEPEDKINSYYQCARLTGLDSRDGSLLLGTTHFYVIEGITILKNGEILDIESAPIGSYEPVVPSHLHYSIIKDEAGPVPIGCIKWPYDTIREVHKRRYLLRHCALEVFSSDGRNHFLIFHQSERDKIYQKLLSLAKSSLTENSGDFVAGTHPDTNPEHSRGIFSGLLAGEKALPDKWADGDISNFQYLMHLNTLAGRSYNDLMQYPIFPWVVADYESETLDLTNPKTFRDFSLPMGAQTPTRLARFIERYKYFEDPTGENTPPYYYGTHYSSAMIVASYLIRMEPFTQHFLKLQGGHFDLPDRLFHSIPDAWRSASETNMADVKELIPEFFYLPEFLMNSNNFDLGTKQSGERLDDIVLPPWAKGDAQEFIRIHREALECDYVSAHLHEWIDLIFGCKQTGREALEAHNVFHHLFYEGAVDIDKIDDPVKRNAAISFINNFGQMPKQLFKKPHRPRKVLTATIPPTVDTPPAQQTSLLDSRRVFYKNLVQLMPSREPLKEIRSEVNQIVYVADRNLVAVEKNRLLLPPTYTRYFTWGYPDHSARIALVEGDRVTSVFEGLHQGRILCASVADEHTLLTGGDSTVVCVWEMKHSGPKERARTQLYLKDTLHGHTAPVTCLATSANYNLIVSGSKDKTCILWDINKFVFVRQLCGHAGPVTIVTINQLNGNIVSCTRNQIWLWTVNGTLLAQTTLLFTGNFRLLCCAVSELFEWDKDNVIVTGSSDGIVRMWALQYVSDVEMTPKHAAPFSRGNSMESDLDCKPRAVTVIRRLRTVTLDIRNRRSHSSPLPTSSDDIQKTTEDQGDSDEEFYDSPEHPVQWEGSCSTEQLTGVEQEENMQDRTEYQSNVQQTVVSYMETEILADGTSHGECGVSESDHSTLTSPEILEFPQQWDTAQSEPPVGGTSASDRVAAGRNAYDQFLAESRRKSEELKERAGKWTRKLTQVHQLTMHTSFSREDNDTPASVTSLCITKDHRKLFIGDSRGRVFSWSVSDNLGSVMEHWLKDEAVDNCMQCQVEFTFTERKHHCRDCGKIFCAKCSSFECEIDRLRITKKVRVCGDCYNRLTKSRHKT